MKSILLKMPEEVLQTTGRGAEALKMSRAQYIRKAIDRMNSQTRALVLENRLKAASLRVRKESMRVNAEFAAFERDPDV